MQNFSLILIFMLIFINNLTFSKQNINKYLLSKKFDIFNFENICNPVNLYLNNTNNCYPTIEKSYNFLSDTDSTLYEEDDLFYDENNNLIHKIHKNGSGTLILDESYSYNQDNLLIEYIENNYQNNQLTTKKITYSYNSNNNIYELINYTKNNNNWIPENKINYYYDANNRLIQYITFINQSYNINPIWKESYKVENYYLDNNRISLTITYLWNNISNQWINYFKTNYEYNDLSNAYEINSYNYLWQNNVWCEYSKNYSKINSQDKILESINWTWSQNNWNYTNKWLYYYCDEYLIKIETFQWSNIWDLVSRYIYEYTNGCLRRISYYYDQTNNDNCLLSKRIYSFYNEQDLGNNNLLDRNELIIFPNPTNNIINFEFNRKLNEVYSIKIYNVRGEKIREIEKELLINNNSIFSSLDISDLSAGIYFLKVENNKNIINKKFLIIK